jgi:hypothetical protein
MRRFRTRTYPQPGELWLSCPPYLLIAHILDVDEGRDPGVVTYELHDENGYPLERVSATLDEGWWQAFQPLIYRCG